MITETLKNIIPFSIREKYSILKYKRQLKHFAPIDYDLSNLMVQTKPALNSIFKNQTFVEEWNGIKKNYRIFWSSRDDRWNKQR